MVGLLLFWLGGEATAKAQPRRFPVDATPSVRLNWDSFVAEGFPSNWENAVKDVIISSITKWRQVGGARIEPVWIGNTTRTAPTDNEILIIANEAHGTPRLGSTFGGDGSRLIIIHRKNTVGGTPYNWVPYRAVAGEVGLEAVLLHELGHAIGFLPDLPCDSANARRTMRGCSSWTTRYGPMPGDRDALVGLYGARHDQPLYAYRSTDDGASFSSWSNLSSVGVRTTTDIGAARDSSNLLVSFTTPDKVPAYIRGSVSTATFGPSYTFFGGERSHFGTAVAGGDPDVFLWSWVDTQNSDLQVRIVRTTNGGDSWVWANPPSDTTTSGTPGLCHVSGSTWVLAYSKFDWSDQGSTGHIYARVTTNDGASWGPETVVSASYHANTGVSCTANGSNVRIGFSWASRSTSMSNARVRTIRATVSGSTISYDGVIIENSVFARNQPALVRNLYSFHRAMRGTNAATTLFHSSLGLTASSWGATNQVLSVPANAAPALAADPNASFLFMFATY